MRKVPLRRRKPSTGPPPTTRQRRERNVTRVVSVLLVLALADTWRQHGWQGAAWFVLIALGAYVAFVAIGAYVAWPVRKVSRRDAPPVQDWAVADTPPDARVYRGHPHFFYETQQEAHERRISGEPDTKVRPRQPDSVKMQRRGGKSLFRTVRKPYETEMAAAMEKMLERRRGELETCDSPAALITSVLVEAMGGDQPPDEIRDWFVTTVLSRVDSDRYWARLPPLADARAEFRGKGT